MTDAGTKKQGERTRELSTIEFPYADLDSAISVAKAVHELSGECGLDQLAGQLDHENSASGGFRQKVTAARIFGAIDQDRNGVRLIALGKRLIDDDQVKAAKVEAFLTVPLYKAVYDKYKGMTLPPDTGLEAAMMALGVSDKSKDRARQVFQRSAKQAGFFDFGTTKLIAPANVKAAAKLVANDADGDHEDKHRKRERTDDLHPFIEGLLGKLPKAEGAWSLEDRRKWLEAAAKMFDLMYTDTEGGEITIAVVREVK